MWNGDLCGDKGGNNFTISEQSEKACVFYVTSSYFLLNSVGGHGISYMSRLQDKKFSIRICRSGKIAGGNEKLTPSS